MFLWLYIQVTLVKFKKRLADIPMDFLTLVSVMVLALLIFYTKDNIYASLLLTGLGVAVALGSTPYLGAVAFILITLVYIVAALTLVVIAAASMGDVAKPVEFRKSALAAIAVALAASLLLRPGPQQAVQHAPDYMLIPLAAAFIVYVLKIAMELNI